MQESFYDFLKQRSAGVETPGQPKSFYEHLEMQKAKASMPYVEQGIQDIGQKAKQVIQPLATLAGMVAEAPQPKPKKPESFLEHLQLVSGEARSWQPTPTPEQPPMPTTPTMGPMTPALERKQQEFMAKPTMPEYTPPGVTVSEGAVWTRDPTVQKISEKVAERAPMYLISPTAGLMFEGITQAKNIIVPLVEKSKYDVTAQRMLADLLPEDTAPWLRTALTTGEMGADMLIAGFGLRKAAEVPGKILKDTFKNIYAKAKAAGYTREQLDKVKALADKFIKPGTIKEEIARNIKARRGKVKAPKGRRLQEPTTLPEPTKTFPEPPTDFPEPMPEFKIVSDTKIKLTNPKQQKQWLMKEVDTAIEQVPKDLTKPGVKDVVQFEVPGDGVFEILNNPESLEYFKKKVNRWPIQPLKVKRPTLPSMKRQPVSAKTLEEIKWDLEGAGEKLTPEQLKQQREQLLEERGLTKEQTIQNSMVDDYYNDVVADLKKERKGGFIKITPKDKKARFSDKQIEKAVSTTRFPVNEVQAIKEKGVRMKHGFKNVFEYEHTLKDVPKFKNDVRLFQDVPWDAFLDAQKKTLATVGKLDRAEYKTLEKYIALKSF
ncbi:MAG: hypothetical protein RTV41_15240, partial [Candidatus Thorarchaeota archaeon]